MDPSQQQSTQQRHNPEYLTAYPLPSNQRRYSPSPSSTSPNPQYIHLVPHANLTIPSTLPPGPSAHYTTTTLTPTLSSSYAHMPGGEPHHPHHHHHAPQYGAGPGTTHPSVPGYLPAYANMPLMPLSMEPTLSLDTMGMQIPAAGQQPQPQQQQQQQQHHAGGGGGELQLLEDRQSRQADTLTPDAGGSTREGGGERGTSAESGDSSSGVRGGGNRRGSGSTIVGGGGGGVGKKTRGRPRMDSNDENAADRRRTQIRLAQRAYRMRKETTITSLRSRVEALEKHAEEMQTLFHELYDAALNHHQLDPGVYRESINQLSDRFQALQAPSVAAGYDVGAESTHDDEADQEKLELMTNTPSRGLKRRTSGDDDDGSGSSGGTLRTCVAGLANFAVQPGSINTTWGHYHHASHARAMGGLTNENHPHSLLPPPPPPSSSYHSPPMKRTTRIRKFQPSAQNQP
ncbi:hypothetical protein EX30DRAFT_380705 [Ascodesmis nigricans]|uniref:BZIP domain-containing protein n=1 Tax=Ascodesmis nigricans TaxID=341454 RepID=A0A4S2N2X9_9PEZI|nr:hypothetical protein EX30DRAFT_380705 [Ascodesmis nigricans]